MRKKRRDALEEIYYYFKYYNVAIKKTKNRQQVDDSISWRLNSLLDVLWSFPKEHSFLFADLVIY